MQPIRVLKFSVLGVDLGRIVVPVWLQGWNQDIRVHYRLNHSLTVHPIHELKRDVTRVWPVHSIWGARLSRIGDVVIALLIGAYCCSTCSNQEPDVHMLSTESLASKEPFRLFTRV